MPVLHLIAGPNGAGKSTLYRALLAPRYPGLPWINADHYEREHLHAERNPQKRSELARAWADGTRDTLLTQGTGFITETVFSHPSKLELLRQARRFGFGIALYIVCVDEPRLLLGRVRQRVREGGHDVPADKVIARYPRTLHLLRQAIGLADLVFLFDGVDIDHGGPALIASVARGCVQRHAAVAPRWVKELLQPSDDPLP